MYVLPDPYSATYVTSDVMTAAGELGDVIERVTDEDFGPATLVTAEVAEVSCIFATEPTVIGDMKKYTISGNTDVEAFVYCWG